MNGKLGTKIIGKHEERTSEPTKNGSRFRNRILLTAGLAGLAVTSCSNPSSSKTDAGQCQMVKDDAGMQACAPADSCELTLVSDNPTGKDGSTGPATAKCVPKQKVDASAVDTTSGIDGTSSIDGYAAVDVEAVEVGTTVPDATTAVDTASVKDASVVDAAPVCSVVKQDRVYVSLGTNWIVGGVPCDVNGSPSALDNNGTVQRKTEAGDVEDCAVAAKASTKRVTATCPTVTVNAGPGGCTQTSAGVTGVCSDVNNITATGSTTVSTGVGSRAALNVTATQSGKSQQVFVSNGLGSSAGSQVTTDNLNPADTQTTVAVALTGNVGDDGKAPLAIKVSGPTGTTTTCGIPVGKSPVTVGDATVANQVSETDVWIGSKFSADVSLGGQDFYGVSENGSALNFGGSLENPVGMVANGASGAVGFQDSVTGKTCEVLVGQDSAAACNKQFNGKSVTVKAVYHTNSCTAKAGTDASVASGQDATLTSVDTTSQSGPIDGSD